MIELSKRQLIRIAQRELPPKTRDSVGLEVTERLEYENQHVVVYEVVPVMAPLFGDTWMMVGVRIPLTAMTEDYGPWQLRLNAKRYVGESSSGAIQKTEEKAARAKEYEDREYREDAGDFIGWLARRKERPRIGYGDS